MRQLGFLTLFFLLLVSACLSDDLVKVQFHCSPTETEVFVLNESLEWEPLGGAEKPISFDAAKFTLFQFRAEGYEVREEAIASKNFGSHRWPNSGVLKLEPLLGTKVKKALLYFGWLLFVPIGLFFFIRRIKRERDEKAARLAYLESLQSEAKLTKDDVLGQRLGNYLLNRFLGKGGSAVVYQAVKGENIESGEKVAIKVLSALDDETSVARFKREVQISQKLIHPNIVALYDWGKERELIYLAMELIDGGSLEDKMKDQLDFGEALRFFGEILDGVDFAHKMGVTHRDLKPENILITKNGRAKVTDFGLARLRATQPVTVTGSVVGTPAYMAPEQIQGESPSPSMDQYSLGVLGFELFTGRLPFDSQDMMVMITKHLTEDAPHPQSFKEDLPSGLCDILLKMLDKDPARRFSDLGEVKRALKALPQQNS